MSMLRRVLDRDSVVKANLVERLVDCVKELQLKYAAENGAALVNDEATNTLCWILEAVFIHGLKNRFIKTVSSILTSGRENSVPDPSFWHFVLIFCHQEDIMEIEKFSFVHTDIGRCRAWLRLSLNQGTLISFLQMMIMDKSTLKDYYKPTSFLRDSERFDILKSILYGIESYQFQLACNSSFLNAWNYVPLSLVGLHTSSHAQESISQGIDVAQNMNSKELQALPQIRQGRTPPKPHGFPPNFEDHYRTPLLEEDEALRVILSSKHSNSSGVPSPSSSRRSSDVTQPSGELLKVTNTRTFHSHSSQSKSQPYLTSRNSIIENQSRLKENHVDSGVGSSSSVSSSAKDAQYQSQVPFNNCNSNKLPVIHLEKNTANKIIPKDVISENANQSRTQISQLRNSSSSAVNIPSPDASDELSYAALFETYNKDKPAGTPIMSSFILENEDLMNSSLAINSCNLEENRSNTVTPVDQVVGFEVISNTSSSGQFSDMFPHINTFIQRIPNEMGMDSQNCRCKNCSKDIHMIFQPARLCGLTGSYYCSDCHANDEFVIPSRIILNWDFTRYSVSKQAKDYLEDILYRPLFDLQEINPMLYDEVEECMEIQNLRTKLLSISIYLRTCKSAAADFSRESWPNDHLYENVHLYSLYDLLNIPNRTLATNLKKLVTQGKSHITSCEICAQKGFVCEVCKNAKVIFPFDLDVIFKCSSCGAVYHKECMNICKPCPRCIRWKKADEDKAGQTDDHLTT